VVYEAAMPAGVAAPLNAGNYVLETGNPAGALDFLTAFPHYLDLVIVTCLASQERPHCSSRIGLVEAMFQRCPWIPVIIVGRAQESAWLIGQTLLTGTREVLERPVSAVALRRCVTRVVLRRGAKTQAAPAIIAAMKQMVVFLGEQGGKNLMLGELAAMAAMSPSHLSHVFHDVIGMSLRDCLRDIQLKRAHELLLGSTLSLSTIAVDAGFYDLPHLDKAFRQRLGMTPQAFRRRHRPRGNGDGSGPARRARATAVGTRHSRKVKRPAVAPVQET
jgi:AraC-like DNA-binding protein